MLRYGVPNSPCHNDNSQKLNGMGFRNGMGDPSSSGTSMFVAEVLKRGTSQAAPGNGLRKHALPRSMRYPLLFAGCLTAGTKSIKIARRQSHQVAEKELPITGVK